MKPFNVSPSMSYRMQSQLGLISSYFSSHCSRPDIISHSFSLSPEGAPAIVSLPNFYSVFTTKFKHSLTTTPIPSSNQAQLDMSFVLSRHSAHTHIQSAAVLQISICVYFLDQTRASMDIFSTKFSLSHIWRKKHTKFYLFLFRESRSLLLYILEIEGQKSMYSTG